MVEVTEALTGFVPYILVSPVYNSNDIQLFSFTEFYKSSGFNNRRKSWQHLEYTGIDPGFSQWGRA